ncbi:MAG: hypothetical protein AAFO96_13625 [Bacteroidota bacterium]
MNHRKQLTIVSFFLILVAISIVTSGCWVSQFAKYYNDMEAEVNWDQQVTFDYERYQILLDGDIGLPRRYLLDLGGADVNFMTEEDSVTLSEKGNMKLVKGGWVQGASKERTRAKYMVVDSLWSPLFTGKDYFSVYLSVSERICELDGIVGRSLFEDSTATLWVNMDQRQLSIFRIRPELDDTWTEIPIRINLSGLIFVTLDLSGLGEEEFIFDTGFNGGILLKKNPQLALGSDWESRGEVAQTVNGFVTDTLSKIKRELRWDKISVKDQDVYYYNQTVKVENLMGMQFIENYNFVIDYKEERLFLQNRKQQETYNSRKSVRVRYINGNPTIVNIANTPVGRAFKLDIGDILREINKKPVEDDDICSLNDKINSELEAGTIRSISVERKGSVVELYK